MDITHAEGHQEPEPARQHVTHNSRMDFELAHLLDTGWHNNQTWESRGVVQPFTPSTFS